MNRIFPIFFTICFFTICFTGCIHPGPQQNNQNYTIAPTISELTKSSIVNNFTFLIPVPDSPTSIPAFRGILKKEDQIDYGVEGILQSRQHVISEAEAWNATNKALEKYGGIPSDAIFTGTRYTYETTYDSATKTSQKKPIIISVGFKREIDGKPIVGLPDMIHLDFGETEEPLSIYKRWRTIEPAGYNVSVIPLETALGRFERFETMSKVQKLEYSYNEKDYFPNATIRKMTLGFNEASYEDPDIIFQPVWIIEGNWANGKKFSNYVYARQFANFTDAPMNGLIPLSVKFIDNSDSSPTRWLWDFGDGTNTTEQNPVHSYETAGTYNVTFTTWNDLGSDTVTKPVRVTP